jgi:hypothetical protein
MLALLIKVDGLVGSLTTAFVYRLRGKEVMMQV